MPMFSRISIGVFSLALIGFVQAETVCTSGFCWDSNDLRSHEYESSYTSTSLNGKTVAWTSSSVPLPSVEKHNDGCARIPEYMDGGICYKLCGGSLHSVPIRWRFYWRPAGFGHDVPFQICDESTGCKGFNTEFYPSPARGCGYFMFWKPHNFSADMRMEIDIQ